MATPPQQHGQAPGPAVWTPPVQGGAPISSVVPPSPTEAAIGTNNLWLAYKKLIGDDLGVVFGDTSSGKTRTAAQIALDARAQGIRVTYYDTEHGLSTYSQGALQQAGVTIHTFNDPAQFCAQVGLNDPPGLVIVDSATLFITGRWYALDTQGRGRLLQQLQSMYWRAKDWAMRTKSMALMTAQPTSSFAKKDKESIMEPMGDKAGFMSKVIIYLDARKNKTGGVTSRTMRIYKSRDWLDGTVLCNFETTPTGIEVSNWEQFRAAIGGPL